METKKALITPQVHIQERKRLISSEEFTPMSPFQTCTYKLVSLHRCILSLQKCSLLSVLCNCTDELLIIAALIGCKY